MLTQSHPFFVDVQFFDIEHHLLLQTVAVHLQLEFCKTAQNFFPYCSNPFLLVCFHFTGDLQDAVHLRSHVLLQHLTFPYPVGNRIRHCLLYAVECPVPIVFVDDFHPLLRRNDLWHPHQRRQEFDENPVFFGRQLRTQGLEGFEVVQYFAAVYSAFVVAYVGLPINEKVYAASVKLLRNVLSDNQFFVFRKKLALDVDVRILAVHGLYFKSKSSVFQFKYGFSIPCHRL